MHIAKELILYIFLSIFFFKFFYKYISQSIIDIPVYRSSHIGNVPTSAGIIFLFIYAIYIKACGDTRVLPMFSKFCLLILWEHFFSFVFTSLQTGFRT